jgi:hypothetical protein
LRALHERHGGRGVLWALLAVLALALAARVLAAAHGIDVRNGSDADMYERLAASLYRDGAYGLPGSANPYDFAPGAPLFAAAIYNLIGAESPVAARVGMAVAGTVGVLLVYMIGRRLGSPRAGVVAAGIAAVYPATLFYAGLLSGEPLAMVTVAGAVLAFLWAGDAGRSPWAWAVPGALLGLTAFARPEYVALTALLALVAGAVIARRAGLWRGANLARWTTSEPGAVAKMMAGKVAHMWRGAGAPGLPGAVLHYVVLALGLAGLVLLARRRRWEVLPIVALVVGISVIGALLLAGTRRNMPVMPLVIALAGVSAVASAEWARDRRSARRAKREHRTRTLQRSIAHGG